MEVLAVGDQVAPAFGTPDPDVLRWSEHEGYVLGSRNRLLVGINIPKADEPITGVALRCVT